MKSSTLSATTLQSILELSSSYYLLVSTRENVITQVHPRLLDILGYTEEELRSQPFSILTATPLAGEVDSAQSKKGASISVSLSTKDNKQCSALLWIHKNAITDQDENFHCLFVEIQEPELEPQSFLDLQDMLARILDTIPSRIFWKDRNLVYKGCNRIFAKDAGLPPGEPIVGKTDFDFAWKKEEAEFYRSIDRRVMESGKEELNIIEPQLQADGTEAWLETNKLPITNDKGEVIGMLGTYADITERIRSEELIKKRAKELEIKNRELEQFAYIASHDLQEPLRTLSSFVDLLEQEFPAHPDDQVKKYMDYITDSASRMRHLITGLLEYSRLGRNQEKKEVDCNQLVQTILTDLQLITTERKASIELQQLPTVWGNDTELRLLFQNLIQNAIKFHKPGTTPEVTISAQEDEKHWTIVITDLGIGINPAYTSKIFVIFQRLHTKTEYQGTGIGLAYCKKIVDLMGGEIWVKSEEGKGSSFYFTIPKGDDGKQIE